MVDILGGSAEQVIQKIVSIGTGVAAWEYQATAKYAEYNEAYKGGYSLFSTQRFGDALAGILGNQLTRKIIPGWGGAADFKPNPLGAINKTSVTGGALLFADAFLRKTWDIYRNDLDMIPDIVQAVGIGVTVGGIVGGIFDPVPPLGNAQPQAMRNPIVQRESYWG